LPYGHPGGLPRGLGGKFGFPITRKIITMPFFALPGEFIRFTPCIGLFECKTWTMLAMPTSLSGSSLWGWAIENAILP
jgi:hypothetical protein